MFVCLLIRAMAARKERSKQQVVAAVVDVAVAQSIADTFAQRQISSPRFDLT